MEKPKHEIFMRQALKLAQHAQTLGEVPVGALVMIEGHVVGLGFNARELKACALEHAELMAIRNACRTLGRWRLTGATLYVTLEPCIMCTGAMLQSRISHLVYGPPDPKFGAIESLYELATDSRLNHRFSCEGGVLASESAKMLRDFFRQVRQNRSI